MRNKRLFWTLGSIFLTLVVTPTMIVFAQDSTWLSSPSNGIRCNVDFGESNTQGNQDFHNGLDFCGGTQVVAVNDGIVVWNSWCPPSMESSDTGHGITTVIYHPKTDVYSYSAHMGSVNVELDQNVIQGQILGEVGTTGYMDVKNKHVHFAISKDPPDITQCSGAIGIWEDPNKYLGKATSEFLPSATNTTLSSTRPPQKPTTVSAISNAITPPSNKLRQWIILVGFLFCCFFLIKNPEFGFFLSCCLAAWVFFLARPVYAQQNQDYSEYEQHVQNVWQIDVNDIKQLPGKSGESYLGTSGNNGVIAPLFTSEVQYWGDYIVKWADEWGVDPNLAATVMQIESCGDPQAGSSAGAMSLFQVMPFHFATGEDGFDPSTNAYRGMAYLSKGLKISNGNAGLALAGYNGGHSRIGLPQSSWANETQRYYYWGTGIYQDAVAGKLSSDRLDEWLGAGGASLCRQASNRLGLTGE